MATQNVATIPSRTQSAVDPQHSSTYFNLPNNVIARASRLGIDKKFSGIDVVNVIDVIANHANIHFGGRAWVSPRTIAAESGLREHIVTAIIAHAEANGILERGTWQGKTTGQFIPNDGGPPGHRVMSVESWAANADLGKSRGLEHCLLALADGHRRFITNVQKDLAPQLGVSDATLYRMLKPLVDRGRVKTKQHGRATEFEMLEITRKRKATSVSAKPLCVSCPPSCVSAGSANSLTGMAFGTEGLVLQGHVEQGHVKSKQDPTQDERRAEKRADAAATIPIFAPSGDQNPPVDHSTHIEGFVEYLDQRGNRRLRDCPECRAAMAAKQAQADEARQREFVAPQTRPLFDFSMFTNTRTLPALPSAPVVEGEWHETPAPTPCRATAKPVSVITGKTAQGGILFDEFRRRFASHTAGLGVLRINPLSDPELQPDLNRMLGVLSGIDIDAFDAALAAEMLFRGQPRGSVRTGKLFRDILGCVVNTLTGDERFGRHESVPVYQHQQMHAA